MIESNRKQTTKGRVEIGLTRLTIGIWMSRALNSNILIMDVEGTDSRERGDEQVIQFSSPLTCRSLSVGRPYFRLQSRKL